MTTAELLDALVGIARCVPNEIEARWCLFGSAVRDAERAADFDLAIVCAPEDAPAIRRYLAPWCLAWPLHLTILTPDEDAALQFTDEQGATQFYPG